MMIFPVLTPNVFAVHHAGKAQYISEKVWMCFDTIVLLHE